MTISACSEDGSGNSGKKIPTGLWVLRYFGNEKGEYVEEFNMTEGYGGRQTNYLEMVLMDYGHMAYFDLDEKGEGTFTDLSDQTQKVIFDSKMIDFEDYGETAYTRKGDVLWFKAEYEDYYLVMENVSETMFRTIANGAFGCVDIGKAKIGDLVAFGTFETWPLNDRTEALRWKVIDVKGDNLLIISDQLIDSFSFNYNPNMENLDTVTWENSSLRQFLNDPEGFMTMFTEEELAKIQETHLENKAANKELMSYWGDFHDIDERQTYSDMAVQDLTDDPETDDKIFLLSFQEVGKYFGKATEAYAGTSDYPFDSMPASSKWIAYITRAVDYNYTGSGFFDYSTYGGAWITRTLATDHHDEKMVTYITGQGQVFIYFTYVPMFIRPAMWIHR